MNDDTQKHNDQFDAALPLPINDNKKSEGPDAKKEESKNNPAAELIRKKVAAAYGQEPDSEVESEDLEETGQKNLSKHQRFILDLTDSGKPLNEIQVAWHEYYAALPDDEKHQVWQEFYKTHQQASHFRQVVKELPEAEAKPALPAADSDAQKTPLVLPTPTFHLPSSPVSDSLEKIRHSLNPPQRSYTAFNPRQQLKSLVFGLSVGVLVLFIFLFSFFNERFIAPFIQPSRNVSNTPIISTNAAIGPNPEIIIPKINVEIPVIYTVSTTDDNAIENALEGGVVHYADTATPGQDGNVVIVGHSSNNIFNPGKYKFAFVLLSRLDNGDTFYLQKDGKRYTYEVYKKQIVSPTDVSVLGPADKPATATLITCDPPGTSANRLVVTGEQIDPSVASNNTTEATAANATTQSAIIPGNSPSLWSRLVKWLWG